jgi:hypothetical protein
VSPSTTSIRTHATKCGVWLLLVSTGVNDHKISALSSRDLQQHRWGPISKGLFGYCWHKTWHYCGRGGVLKVSMDASRHSREILTSYQTLSRFWVASAIALNPGLQWKEGRRRWRSIRKYASRTSVSRTKRVWLLIVQQRLPALLLLTMLKTPSKPLGHKNTWQRPCKR